MAELTSVQRDKLMTDLKLVISDAEELLRLTEDQASSTATEVRGRIQNRLHQARLELAHLQETAVAKAKAAGHAADEFVHENPWKSIGVAAGIGLVVGLLIARR